MHAADLRRSFLDFFAARGHAVVPSSSLVPANDPTLYFTNAGMVQFKDVFLGAEKRPYSRAVTVQKCMRVSGKHNDLESVGFTARHHTLFEMLGNFSFGDYFKEDAIAFAWEYLTRTVGLPADRLLVTVFEHDDEAAVIWRKLGLPSHRIGRGPEKDNFWSMGPTGPCGPCSEIFWDLERDFVPDHELDLWGFGHDAGRYMEIWNNVFMQHERYEEGGSIRQRDLPRPSVDTGMGLERLAAICQGHKTNWEIDEFQALISLAGSLAGTQYGAAQHSDQSLRVVADHARAAAFLVGDGVTPSNEGRGYVLRRILRRAIRHGVKLGLEAPFMHRVALGVCDRMGDAYPELVTRRAFIEKVVHAEEQTFRQTLERGLTLLEDAFRGLQQGDVVPGATVFQLHDTFGFPPDLTRVIATERGFGTDDAGYERAMDEQRARSRANWEGTGEQQVGAGYHGLESGGATDFVGYDRLVADTEIVALLAGGQLVAEAPAGSPVEVVLRRTPCYAEGGGQVGDEGVLRWDGGQGRISAVQKPGGSVFVHLVEDASGTLRVGQQVSVEVLADRRGDIRRNHTATHLLHAALRRVLGDHVQQKGSLVAPDRLRFDFSHFEPITEAERERIEAMVNLQILADVHTVIGEHAMADAAKMGAMALFGEKYGERVRVVEVPGFSVELCGGTHCGGTGEIGLFKIVSEGGIAAGVRRIEAVTGRGALQWVEAIERRQAAVLQKLKARPDDLVARIEKLLDERKSLGREVEELRQKLVMAGGGAGREVAGQKIVSMRLDGVDGKAVRGHADAWMEKLGSGVVILGATDGDKVTLLIKVHPSITNRVAAGDLVRTFAPRIGGNGGGKADMAQAGGKDASALDEVLAAIEQQVVHSLGGA